MAERDLRMKQPSAGDVGAGNEGNKKYSSADAPEYASYPASTEATARELNSMEAAPSQPERDRGFSSVDGGNCGRADNAWRRAIPTGGYNSRQQGVPGTADNVHQGTSTADWEHALPAARSNVDLDRAARQIGTALGRIVNAIRQATDEARDRVEEFSNEAKDRV